MSHIYSSSTEAGFNYYYFLALPSLIKQVSVIGSIFMILNDCLLKVGVKLKESSEALIINNTPASTMFEAESVFVS